VNIADIGQENQRNSDKEIAREQLNFYSEAAYGRNFLWKHYLEKHF
jgi:hypothetical protein